jgi:membrane protease YdiL (CAAX protease family)
VRHRESPEVAGRRQRIVGGGSVLGAGLLGVSLSTQPGSRRFYGTSLGVAAVWTLAGLASGPLHLGWIQSRDQRINRPVLVPILTGAGAFGFFYGCALVARRIPLLDRSLVSLLRFADQGHGPLLLLTTCANGLAEEVFFRGALYGAVTDRHPVATSTAVYTLATVPTRNPALVLAAPVMGTLFALQRRASGGLQAPALTHLTWSALMLRYLPPLFRPEERTAGASRRAVMRR